MEVLKKISVKQKGITDKLDTLDEMQKQKIKGRLHIRYYILGQKLKFTFTNSIIKFLQNFRS